jgi:hypothetical protein
MVISLEFYKRVQEHTVLGAARFDNAVNAFSVVSKPHKMHETSAHQFW